MNVLVNLGGKTKKWNRRSRLIANAIRPILNAQVLINQAFLRTHNVPPLYESGVRYMNEPTTLTRLNNGEVQSVEEFACIPAIITRGWGDCDDLAPWRCAELREAGENATIRVMWKKQRKPNGKRMYHVLVRRADGSIEDPSALLGMKG